MSNIEFYKDLYRKASDYLVENGLNSLPDIPIEIRFIYGRVLGQVTFSHTISNNLELNALTMNFKYENAPENQRVEVFMHEIAHVYCIHYYNESEHSPLFNRIAKGLGAVGGKSQVVSKIDSAMQNREQNMKKFVFQSSLVLSNRDVHAMRCSLKMISKKYNLNPDIETFNKYVAPRYKYIYSEQQIKKASELTF